MNLAPVIGVDMRSRGLRAAEIAAARPHGDRVRYVAGGCRCDACRAANSAYERTRLQLRKEGDWNGIVSAANARAHILALRRLGVGRRSIGAVTDIADTVLSEIISGRKSRIRARTERLILGVTKDAAADHALISAKRSWKLIQELLDEGFTKTALAKRLGYESKSLQFNERFITVRNAYRIAQLHRRLMT